MTSPKQKASGYKRDGLDWYVEPAWTIEVLQQFIEFDGPVLDPCCGSGTIHKVLGGRCSDIVDRGYKPAKVRNFLSYMKAENVVSNPPYKMAQKFIEHFHPITRCDLAVLVRLDFLASQGRWRLYTFWPPTLVIVLSKRPSMPPGWNVENRGGGQHDYCWIVWCKQDNGKTTEIVWGMPGVEDDAMDEIVRLGQEIDEETDK
jgi:hypothetical protein